MYHFSDVHLHLHIHTTHFQITIAQQKKKSIQFYTLSNDRFIPGKEISLSDLPVSMVTTCIHVFLYAIQPFICQSLHCMYYICIYQRCERQYIFQFFPIFTIDDCIVIVCTIFEIKSNASKLIMRYINIVISKIGSAWWCYQTLQTLCLLYLVVLPVQLSEIPYSGDSPNETSGQWYCLNILVSVCTIDSAALSISSCQALYISHPSQGIQKKSYTMLFEPSNLVSSSAIILFNALLTHTVIFYAHARNPRVWSRACAHTTWLLKNQ